MTTTTFNNGTIIQPTWLNDVNTATYTTLPAIISGATPVGNGVVTTQNYADPAWIVSLAGAKITGTVANATAAVTATSATTATTATTALNILGRNVIINGQMFIDQRNLGTSFSVPNASGYGSCDRWGSLANAGTSWTMQQVTNGSNISFTNSLRLQRTATSTSTGSLFVGQVLETSASRPLQGSTCTLSLYAKAGSNFSPSSVTVNVFGGNGVDQSWANLNALAWNSQTTILTSSFTPTTVFTRYTWQVNVPTSTTQLAVRFNMAGVGTAGANDFLDITGVQLEGGSFATPFEYRHYGQDLALCQRYVRPVVAPTCPGMVTDATHASVFSQGVLMRTSPTLSTTSGFQVISSIGVYVPVTAIVTVPSPDGAIYLSFTCSGGGLTAGAATFIISTVGTPIFSAEL